jgi:hypothetical protein
MIVVITPQPIAIITKIQIIPLTQNQAHLHINLM